jgi:hypothetical protein
MPRRKAALAVMPRKAALAVILLLGSASAALAEPFFQSTDSTAGSGSGSGSGSGAGTGNGSSLDTTTGNGSGLTGTKDLTAGQAQDLRSQLSLVNGITAPAGGGWTFVPRLDMQEVFNDNVYATNTNRRWDFATSISPGFALAGDMPRLQLTMTYNPSVTLYARTGDLNALTQQLNALGHITLEPDLAYVDVTAVSGVSSIYGGYGYGSVGAQAGQGTIGAGQTVNAQGLNRNNETQNSNFGINPYLETLLGDYGVAKLSYSLNAGQSSQLSGFGSLPFPTGGRNATSLFTNQESATYSTGDWLGQFQNVLSANLTQSSQSTDAGFVNGFTGQAQGSSTTTNSSQTVISDQITYQVNRTVALFVSGGHEAITYSGVGGQNINDLIWSFGTTLTPNPDSALTVSYGHSNGYNSFQASGHYQATGRTVLTVSYNSTLGTQLQYFQQAVNALVVTNTGQIVTVNGAPLFVTINQLAAQDTVFRTDAFVLGSSTSWDLDLVSMTLSLTKQSTIGHENSGTSTSGKNINFSWVHQMQPDMTLTGNIGYSREDGGGSGLFLGNYDSYSAGLSWYYQLSPSVSLSVSYSFFDRISQSSSSNVYQSLFIVGLSKSF